MNNALEVLIADRLTGRILAEVEPLVGPVSWRQNNVGKTTLRFAKRDPKLDRTLFQFGNLVLIQFDNGLPPWGGVLDLPTTWTDTVEFTVNGAELLADFRTTTKNRSFTSATAGTIVESLLAEANATAPTGLTPGYFWGGGSSFDIAFHYNRLLGVIYDTLLDRLSTAVFYVEAKEEAGYAVFTANLLERRGSDKLNVAFIEGHNLTQIERTVQGPVITSWDVAGADTSTVGNSWGSGRFVSHRDDPEAIARYGLREDSRVQTEIKIQSTLDEAADGLLAGSLNAFSSFSMQSINLAPAAFADYGLGDTVRLEAPAFDFAGYDGSVRIDGREYDPTLGTATVTVTEVN